MRVRPLSLKELYINWEGTKGDRYRLLRSFSPDNDFEILLENTEETIYIDKDVNLFDISIRYYYKVEGYVDGIKVSETTEEMVQYTDPDGIANKVIYEAKLVLEQMRNPPVFALVKKRVGKECPECWNPLTKKVRFANCSVCNGTGLILGYHTPIKIKMSRDVSNLVDTSNLLDGDNVSLSPINAWVGNYPLFSPGDIIIDVNNQRFKVDQVVPRTRSQYVIRQVLNLVPIERGHPAYNVKVDLEVLRH